MFDFIYRELIDFIYRKLTNFFYIKQLKLEQKPNCLPPLSANYYPWLVAHNDDSGDQVFYTIHDQLSCYRCRIPELVGKRIQACFHGWVILSNHQRTHWFLWNPNLAAEAATTLIRLPRLLQKDSRPLDCYLSSPPDVPGSFLLLARKDKPCFVICRLDRLRWIDISYAEQLINITGRHDEILACLTSCCNGEVYALVPGSFMVVKILIVVKEKSVQIHLFPFVKSPILPNPCLGAVYPYTFLTGSSSELLTVFVGIVDLKKLVPVNVYLYKLDMTSMEWVEKEDLKDTVLYVEMVGGKYFCCRAYVSEFGGGYVHILHKNGKVVYSYNVKDKTISMSLMHCLDLIPNHVAVWAMPHLEFNRLQSDGKCKAKDDEMVVKVVHGEEEEEEVEADDVVNLPFDVLEMIMEFCVGVEYLNFRATCKRCHLAAPLRKVPKSRLLTYSLVSSPWLMVFDVREGIITFTDPMFGDKYFIRPPSPEIVSDSIIACSGYGWLLLLIGNSRVAFFNPFTSEIRELPAQRRYYERFCFSSPPTSRDCMVVRFAGSVAFFHFVAGEPVWYPLVLEIGRDATLFSLEFSIFCGQDVYGLRNQEEVVVFRIRVGVWEVVVDRLPKSSCSEAKYFLTRCNQHFLLLMVGDFGETVEIFKLTEELQWEKMDGLGRHVIYVCDALSTSMCLCMAAKTPEMENKIFFNSFHYKNEKVMFYSLETRRFHTFDGRNIGQENTHEDFYQHIYHQAWIEPTWC